MKKKLVIAALMALLLTLGVGGALADDCQNHNWTEWTVKDGTTHSRHCQNDGCYATEYEDHYGGTASCCSKPLCEVCGRAYGKSTGVHVWEVASTTATQHTLICYGCQRTQTADHSGSAATCASPAVCDTCKVAYGSKSDVHQWNLNSAEVIQEATCQTGTVTRYSCSLCDKTTVVTGTDTLDCVGVPQMGKEPTCTEDGYYILVCKMCGEEKGRGETIAKTGHTMQQVAAESPTCTTAGHVYMKCANCDYAFTVEGAPALGHRLINLIDGMDPVWHQGKCERCGYTIERHQVTRSESIDSTGHSNICESCNYAYRTAHRFITLPQTPPASVCQDCGYTCAHWGGEPTCFKPAVCANCNQSYGDPLNHGEHGDPVYYDAMYHAVVCAECGMMEFEKHDPYWSTTFQPEPGDETYCMWCEGTITVPDPGTPHTCIGGVATCSGLAVCDICGKRYGELGDHHYEYMPNDKDTHFYRCIHCDEAGESSHVYNIVHDSVDGSMHSMTCALCDYQQPMHQAETVRRLSATAHEYSCDKCGSVYEAAHDYKTLSVTPEAAQCRTCGYTCVHVGGVTTCFNRPVCTMCGHRYGAVLTHEGHGDEVWYDNMYHVVTCADCGQQQFSRHELSPTDGQGEVGKTYTCMFCTEEFTLETLGSAHTCIGGKATCIELAICDICGKRYGEHTDHDRVYTTLDENTVMWTCSVCGAQDYADQ